MIETELKTRAEAIAKIPSDQRFTWRLAPKPGRLLLAETVGQSLVAMKDIFASVGEHLGQPQIVGVLDVRFDEEGAFVADLVLMPKPEPDPPTT